MASSLPAEASSPIESNVGTGHLSSQTEQPSCSSMTPTSLTNLESHDSPWQQSPSLPEEPTFLDSESDDCKLALQKLEEKEAQREKKKKKRKLDKILKMKQAARARAESRQCAAIRNLHTLPVEVIDTILEYARLSRATLGVLKFAGSNVRAAVAPRLHRSVHLFRSTSEYCGSGKDPEVRVAHLVCSDLDGITASRIMPLVEDLVVGTRYQPYLYMPTRHVAYFQFLQFLSGLTKLRTCSIFCAFWDVGQLESVLDILSVLPHLCSLNLSRPDTGSLSSAYKLVHTKEIDTESSICSSNFTALTDLCVKGPLDGTVKWLIGSERLSTSILQCLTSRVRNIQRLHLEQTNLQLVLALIASQAGTLVMLRITGPPADMTGTDSLSLVNVDGMNTISLPKLVCMSFVQHAYWTPETALEAQPALVEAFGIFLEDAPVTFQAPALRSIGCGHLLDTFEVSAVKFFAKQWSTHLPSLKYVLARHDPPHETHLYRYEMDSLGMIILQKNFKTMLEALTSVNADLLCVGEEDYDAYFDDQWKGYTART